METIENSAQAFEQSHIDLLFSQAIGHLISDLPAEEIDRNFWQVIAGATNDVVTPANALDAAAFGLSIYGLNNLDSWKGIIASASAFGADLVDGKIARATGTQSDLGEAVDAGGDKIKLAFALYQIWKLNLAPKTLIMAVAAQNGYNIGLTAADRSLNDKPSIHPSSFGKKAIFLEQMGLGMHVIGSEVSKQNEKRGRAIKLAGSVVGYAGVGVGIIASSGYTAKLIQSRKSRT